MKVDNVGFYSGIFREFRDLLLVQLNPDIVSTFNVPVCNKCDGFKNVNIETI